MVKHFLLVLAESEQKNQLKRKGLQFKSGQAIFFSFLFIILQNLRG